MNDEHSCDYACDLILNPQPLDFEKMPGDGDVLSYRAVVRRPLAPGGPVFALTLATSVAGADQEQKAEAKEYIVSLTRDLRADFLLTAPWDDSDAIGESDSASDEDTSEMLIVLELVSTTVGGSFGTFFVVQAPLGQHLRADPVVQPPPGQRFMAAPFLAEPHKKGWHHTYRATSWVNGTATSTLGCELIKAHNIGPNGREICFNDPPKPESTPVAGRWVGVKAKTYCQFTISGGFN